MQNHITVRYADDGKFILDYQQHELVASIDVKDKPELNIAHSLTLPGRTLAIACVYNNLVPNQSGCIYEIEPSSNLYENAFKDLCTEFNDIFSTDSGDIRKTPLLEVEIDTGDSLPITQKPYTLPLKHTAWVQRELEILEKAGVIVRSVSPWTSPIVVVPKRTAPREPPKQRLCVDYRALNSLLPPVKKAFSKAKRILSLVPLPKIDEIYARLKGSNIYSTFDMRSGYYHMVLSEKSRPKSAFISSFGKWEFKRCPFGLAQAPTYFQRLVNEILSGLTFAFGYLGDILVYSLDMETHLEHLRKLFIKLREADLKLKEVKCNFLKKHIQYLGHIVLGKGISPMPEKLACI